MFFSKAKMQTWRHNTLHVYAPFHLRKASTNLLSAERHGKLRKSEGRFCYYSHFTNKETAWPGMRGPCPMCEQGLDTDLLILGFIPSFWHHYIFFLIWYPFPTLHAHIYYFLYLKEYLRVRTERSYNHNGLQSPEALWGFCHPDNGLQWLTGPKNNRIAIGEQEAHTSV